MEPHVERIFNEKRDLDAKLAKLNAFIDNAGVFASLPPDHRKLLLQQAAVMKDYSTILDQRLALFPVEHTK